MRNRDKRDAVIIVKNVSRQFILTSEKVTGIKELLIRKLKKDITYKSFFAVNDVSFKIYKGEVVGILGLNGAGKSTILKVISKVMKPSSGEVTVIGNISPMLELGAGFDMELSGRENIYLNGAILGNSKKYLEQKEQEIVEFAELGDFIDVAVKNYSSGMRARLGFSIATAIEPDILIIDEVLGVGDKNFKAKSSEKMRELIKSGCTVLLVSHAINSIRDLCDRCIWLEKGKVKMIGETKKVCDVYMQDVTGER